MPFNIFKTSSLGKVLLYILTDIILIEFSLVAAASLWAEGVIPGSHALGMTPEVWEWLTYAGPAAAIIAVLVYACFKMYNNLWKYANIDEVLKIFIATTIVFLMLYAFHYIYVSRHTTMPFSRRFLFVAWAINTILFFFSRFGYRLAKRIFISVSHIISSKAGCKRVLVIGAGYSGYGVIRGMLNAKIRDKMPVLVIDDDPEKNNASILGIRVISGTNRIPEIVEKYRIDEIVIAVPDESSGNINELVNSCAQTDCTLKIMPPMSDISDGKNVKPLLRDVNITDLLYREEIKLDNKNISNYLRGRTVLVTGGGGSIGSELCRQIMKFNPEQLIIFDIYENNAYQLLNELKIKHQEKCSALIRIGSVRDPKRLDDIFSEFKPHVVFHAAAHKHVALMEDSPAEAVKNNVLGAYNTALCAHRYKAERFVMLSTDKAVNPSSVMGATKRITEMIMQDMSSRSKTKFMAVRFGNVLGSNGSVIPVFMQQIKAGGPVTVTHPDIERYFMTIPEACQLVLQAAGLGQSGRIFVLDMGRPVKIYDLARQLIKLSGYKLGSDIEIVFTGLKAGEKLYEELMLAEEQENLQTTCHNKIYVTKPMQIDSVLFESQLHKLFETANKHPDKIIPYVQAIVPNYTPKI